MIDLTNPDIIKGLDPKDVFGSTGMLADQCKQIWSDSKSLLFSDEYKNIENIVICGMGGSAYGGHVVKAFFKDEVKIPLYLNSDYTLPGFVNEKTLVVLTSYSGNTEECLVNGQLAEQKSAKITGLTSGGKLGEFLKNGNYPSLIFISSRNPSGQPRLGTGYIILGTIALLTNLGLISLDDQTVSSAINELMANTEIVKTISREIAQKIEGYLPVIFSAEFLEGNAHIMRNQFNETSKSFSAFSDIPELNHHLMEGLKNPQDKKIKIIFLKSPYYNTNIQKRMSLTEEVVGKNGIDFILYEAQGSTKLSQMLHTLSFGAYLTVYLAFIYGLDPSLIPWVDYFKQALTRDRS